MSNIIPIVSSSPPPYEDGQSHGWGDDDDDDFGNFASAPAFSHAPSDDGHDGRFDVDWSQASSDASAQTSKESSPQKDMPLPSDHFLKETETEANLPAAQSAENLTSLANGDDEFADFATFQDDAHSKPSVGSLPLHSTDPNTADASSHGTTGESTNSHSNSRESTTDSGMFSSDLSPVPKSDSTSECDKIIQSEDETFADLLQDGQQNVDFSPVCQDGKTDNIGEENCSATVADVCDNTESGCPSPYSELGDGSPVSFPEEFTPGCDEFSGTDGLEQRGDAVHESTAEGADVNLNEDVCDEAVTTPAASDVDDQGLSEVDNTEPVGSNVKNELDVISDQNGDDQQGDKNWVGFATFDGQQDSPNNEENTFQIPPNSNRETDDPTLRVKPCESEQKQHDGEGVDGLGDFPTSVIHSGDQAVCSEPDLSRNCVQAEEVPTEGATNLQKEASVVEASDTRDSDKSSRENDRSDDVSSQNSVAIEAVQTDQDGESHQHAANSDEDDFGDFIAQPASAIELSVNVDNVASKVEEDDDFGDFSGQPTLSASPQESGAGDICAENSDSRIAPKVNTPDISSAELVSSTSDTISCEKGTLEGDEDDEFGDFSARPVPDELPLKQPGSEDFAAVSTENASERTEDDDDDFGDFSGQSFSAAPAEKAGEANDFSSFSGNAANTGSGDEDDFGDFNSQTASTGKADEGTGWAAFGENTEAKPADSDDFGDFPEQMSKSRQAVSSAVPAGQHFTQVREGNKLEKLLTSCFPELCQTPNTDQPGAPDEEESEADRNDLSGTLGTILKFGLRYRSASQQTWQVVEHPSKRDPRVKLWHHLEDVDGSPAVVYQWIKSSGNSQLLRTLHIDTQNMLIGHKKPSVPIFATGLSLLEPIRGGSRDRNDRSQLTKETPNNLVDPSRQENDKHLQDIPAVDFDWSTSGLTNPLTSKSLDLDFLVVQEHDSSEKLSDEWDWVFESELLDAPRSNVKPLQPLEDILKNVKPTSVRSRRDDPVAHMSEEAARVLAGLPDLTFMHSKVLMFPIKN